MKTRDEIIKAHDILFKCGNPQETQNWNPERAEVMAGQIAALRWVLDLQEDGANAFAEELDRLLKSADAAGYKLVRKEKWER